MPSLTPEELHRAAARTLAHYERQAQAFWEGTRDHDVSQNIAALLEHIRTPPPFDLLDFGCGPGRDLITFKALGHRPIGLEGAPRLAAMARAHSGCDVLEQSFLELDLPDSHFDGVFANAVLFHLPSQELPRILRELRATLKPGGVLFSSNPRGAGQEGWNGERYGVFYDWPTWHGQVVPLDAAMLARAQHFTRELNEEGLRVVAVAMKELPPAQTTYSIADEADLTLIGYIAFLDPPKESAASALKALAAHGVAVKVLTGDNELVTARVCRQVGLSAGAIDAPAEEPVAASCWI